MIVMLPLLAVALAFSVGLWVGKRRPVTESSASPTVALPVATAGRLDDAFELVADHRIGVVRSDGVGAVTWRNAAAQRLQGTHVGVLVDESIERHLAIALAEGTSEDVLEMYGPPKVVLVVQAHRLPSGGAVAFIDDVSERRRIDQVRTDFVANISHELKTPVGALAVLAETLEDETDPETIRRVVARMQGEADRAARTIDDLMELSRVELGGERMVEPVAVAGVIAEAMGRVSELAAQRAIGVSYLATAGQIDDVVVEGDRRQLISAFGNLVENAVKYSEQGGLVQIRARYHPYSVELSVTDQGVGIPQRDLDRIFERFYRVDRARSRATGGTGLGLSIVRHVASSHGGDVRVESTEGEGSTFTLTLPAKRRTQRADDPGNDAHEGIA